MPTRGEQANRRRNTSQTDKSTTDKHARGPPSIEAVREQAEGKIVVVIVIAVVVIVVVIVMFGQGTVNKMEMTITNKQ